MLNLFGSCPRFINIDDEFDEMFSNIWDPITPLIVNPYEMMFDHYKRPRSSRENKNYVVSIGVGKQYEEKDIQARMEGRKLKVSGKAKEILKNGSNLNQFEREYDIPDNVDISKMSTKLANGTLHIIFEKMHVEPKKEIEYMSTDKEFKVKMNFAGFKPEEMNIKLVGYDLTIEATKSSESTEGGCSHSMSGYVSRTIRLPPEVELDKLKAVKSENGVEIKAPKDPKKAIKKERTLKIENK